MTSTTSTHLVIKRRAAWDKYSSWLLPKSFGKEEVEPFCSLTHKSTLLYNGFHRKSKIQTKQHLFAVTYVQCKWDAKYANGGREEMHFHYPSYWISFRNTSSTCPWVRWLICTTFFPSSSCSLIFESQSNFYILFLCFFLHKRWGGGLRTRPIFYQPKSSGWNITAVPPF